MEYVNYKVKTINNLPNEILEQILIQGKYSIISSVCRKWYDIVKSNKNKFNEIVFDLTKDDPKKIKKKDPVSAYVYHSHMLNKNSKYICDNFKIFLECFPTLTTMNIVFDILFYVENKNNYKNIFYLSKNIIDDNKDYKIVGIFNTNIYYFIIQKIISNVHKYEAVLNFASLKPKIKYLNIKLKDYHDRIDDNKEINHSDYEIIMLHQFISKNMYEYFLKFSFDAPNNAYIIYDQNKKILIIRYGNYERCKLPRKLINICKKCHLERSFHITTCNSKKYYTFNWFDFPYHLIKINFSFFFTNKKINKLFIISSEFHEYLFDTLSKTSRMGTTKYFCFDKTQIPKLKNNFEFILVEEKEFSFENIYHRVYNTNEFC